LGTGSLAIFTLWRCLRGGVVIKILNNNNNCCIAFGVEVAASSSKYVRSGRKFEIEVNLG
jgi:hypothetical protein